MGCAALTSTCRLRCCTACAGLRDVLQGVLAKQETRAWQAIFIVDIDLQQMIGSTTIEAMRASSGQDRDLLTCQITTCKPTAELPSLVGALVAAQDRSSHSHFCLKTSVFSFRADLYRLLITSIHQHYEDANVSVPGTSSPLWAENFSIDVSFRFNACNGA